MHTAAQRKIAVQYIRENLKERKEDYEKFKKLYQGRRWNGNGGNCTIIVVLIALVALFKDSITKLAKEILKKVTDNAKKI